MEPTGRAAMTIPAAPEPVVDDGWTLRVEGYGDELQRVHDTHLSLAGGGLGASGAPLLAQGAGHRWLVASGVYDGEGPATHLLVGPMLTNLAVAAADERLDRVLDLRKGVLHELLRYGDVSAELIRFVSLARPGALAVRTICPPGVEPSSGRLLADLGAEEGRTDLASWMRVKGRVKGTDVGIVAALTEHREPSLRDDFVAVVWDPDGVPAPEEALDQLGELLEVGFDALLGEHERAWAARWESADIELRGDPDTQFATRFSLFHLMGSVPDQGEAAVGARGLSGTAYRGHVFWDADTFVLPFFAATHPPAARAMLEYRLRRLPAARDIAARHGRAGARFPWESARTGYDVTPTEGRDRTGAVVPILTGEIEEHITADVAWAAAQYVDWTGDQAFASGPFLTLLTETARYWASRVRVATDGTAHIDGVIGPDEYHEDVDDNAFTNVMARWNLQRAADEVGRRGPPPELEVDAAEPVRWREVAAALVDGYDASTGVYEQFKGFSSLEPLVIAEVAPRRPIAADLLLGFDRVRAAQVVKQADAVMLHHLVPDAVVTGSLEANLRRYEPLTAHGSSLSPAIYASLFARVGDHVRALDALRIAERVDLDDLTGTTAGGLHMATMGGLWQALVFGFAGIRPTPDHLVVDPRLPPGWEQLEVRVRYRGALVRTRMGDGQVEVRADRPVPVAVAGEAAEVGPSPAAFAMAGDPGGRS